MPDLTSVSLPPPKDWQAFERLARLLFEHALADPGVQQNGRPGQRQHGVDVFGRRGGTDGPMVGIQCKGKDADYHGTVTEAELKREVEKTKRFKPALQEFILITTAPNDAKIQEAARLLEEQVRKGGRNLSIQVWSWERVHQEIARFPEVIRAFHPDALPFSQEILDEVKSTRNLVETRADTQDAKLDTIIAMLAPRSAPTQIAADTLTASDPLDKHLNTQIDTYRDFVRKKPKTAISLLEKLKEQVWETASARIRYRILANIGAAYHNLGELGLAADFLLEAAPYDPEHPTSMANKIAGLLIKGQKEEAHALAKEAIARYPNNADIALQRIQALGPQESIESVWPLLSEVTRENATLVIFRAMALREQGQPWRNLIDDAGARHPDDTRLQVIQAEGVLERILSHDPGAIGHADANVPTIDELARAVEKIEAEWNESRAAETRPAIELAHNAALLRNILGDYRKAAQLLDETLVLGSEIEESKRLRISLYRRQGKIEEAIRLADQLPPSNLNAIIRADLRADKDPAAAQAILADRGKFTDRKDIVAARLAILESFIAQKKYDDALAEANALALQLPDDPHGPLAIYRVKSARGDADAEISLSAAVALVAPSTPFPTRFLVCEALGKARRDDDVVMLLSGVTATTYDSQALQMLVSGMVNADKRAALRQLLAQIPKEIAEKPFYRRARIGYAIRTGNTRAAENEIRGYLTLKPRSLEMHLQLMHALFRQNKIADLEKEVSRSPLEFDGSPENFIDFAQFKDTFGDWREAHDLAYRTLLSRQADASVNMGYVALFLRPGHSKELETSPKTVAENMAVQLDRDDGNSTVYIIEPEERLRLTREYLGPGHRIAQLLLGAAVGQEITLPDHTKAKIGWIKPKTLHALHTILDSFENTFPDAEGFERVRVDSEKPDLEPILARVRQRHEAIDNVARTYDSGHLPLALVARALGSDPVETLIGMIEGGHTIKVCEGTHAEREAAFEAIRTNGSKGCVVDPITLHVIRRLDLDRVVTAVCGPISVTSRTPLRVQQKIHEIEERIDEPDMSISWRGGQYYRTEVTTEQKRSALDVLKEDRAWLQRVAAVLPAEGEQDLGPEWKAITDRFGRSFLDEARAAQTSGQLLLCEDHMLRVTAQVEFKVEATWLQPVLMLARDAGTLTTIEYMRALVAFADSRMSFISIDGPILLQAVADTKGHQLPSDFKKLAQLLGGAKADLPSHVNVALGCIRATWHDVSLSSTVRQGVVGDLLNNLIKERHVDHVGIILRTFEDFGSRQLGDMAFLQYLRDWMRGHFITL